MTPIGMVWFYRNKRIYLDYAAATPVRRGVLRSMQPYYATHFANPSAIHREGVAARHVVETSRGEVASTLKIRPADVFFTASGTESNNLALIGAVEAYRRAGRAYADMEILSTRIEHPSVTQTLLYLSSLGVRVTYLSVDAFGMIETQSLKDALSAQTILVSFAYANSEVGTVQEVGKLARIVRAFEKEHKTRIYLHLDAAQAPLWLPCAPDRLKVDILTLDAGKCYGPKGVGILARRHGVDLQGILHGGPQEGTLRPATENVPGIVGASHALRIAQERLSQRTEKVTALRDYMIAQLRTEKGVVLNGPEGERRIANNVNISIRGMDSEFAVVSLDEKGIACSTKSACGSLHTSGSAVVREMTKDEERAQSTIRFTLGEETTKRDIDHAVKALKEHISLMRQSEVRLANRQ